MTMLPTSLPSRPQEPWKVSPGLFKDRPRRRQAPREFSALKLSHALDEGQLDKESRRSRERLSYMQELQRRSLEMANERQAYWDQAHKNELRKAGLAKNWMDNLNDPFREGPGSDPERGVDIQREDVGIIPVRLRGRDDGGYLIRYGGQMYIMDRESGRLLPITI